MRQINLLILLATPLAVNAQNILIENAENFKHGTVLTFQKCETNKINPQKGGENVIWDFSKLTRKDEEQLTEKIALPQETTYKELFPNADLVEKYSDGRLVYFMKSKDKNQMVGFVNSQTGMVMHFENPMLFIKRPLAYGDSVTDDYTTTYTIKNMHFTGGGHISIIADGYGTLKLPDNKTYKNVLRVKITQEQTDKSASLPSEIKMTTTTYAWFTKKNTSALLKINIVTAQYYNDKTVAYLTEER